MNHREFRFGIAHLMVVTLLAAISAAIARWYSHTDPGIFFFLYSSAVFVPVSAWRLSTRKWKSAIGLSATIWIVPIVLLDMIMPIRDFLLGAGLQIAVGTSLCPVMTILIVLAIFGVDGE